MEDKIIHAEDEFKKDAIKDTEAVMTAIHFGVSIACVIGSIRAVRTYIPVKGLCGNIATLSAGYAIGAYISSKLPFERVALSTFGKLLEDAKDKRGAEDGGETDSNDNEFAE